VVILLKAISSYSIGGYWWLLCWWVFYWWLLVPILLMVISLMAFGVYFINGY
jgi:hypothetical protein